MNSLVLCGVIGLCFIAFSAAGPVVDDGLGGHMDNMVHVNEFSTAEETLLKKLNLKCTNHDVGSCMMLKLVTYFNRLLKKSSIEIGDVAITQTSTETVVQDSSRNMEDFENMSEEGQVFDVISNQVWNFLRTRSLKWKVTEDTEMVISSGSGNDGAFNLGFSLKPNTEVGDARKKKGGGGGMGALAAAIALKIGLLKALAFKGLALLVGKALIVSKLALVLAAVIGLKKLLHQEKYVTYEVVAHPHHEHHHEHASFSGGGHDSFGGGHGGWGRTLTAGDLAYSAHKPTA